jgi:uncharacterized RDD family membrane protein YckC
MTDEPIRVPSGLTTEGLLGRRYVARAIDSIIIGALAVAALSLLSRMRPQTTGGLLAILLSLFALLILWIGYGALFESSPWQATLGKRLMSLRVYDSEGRRLKVPQAALRNIVKDGPFLLLGLIPAGRVLSFVWLGCHLVVLHRSPVYQAIHDRAAKTWVAAPEATIQLHLTS